MAGKKLSREAIANQEVGRTAITRSLSLVLSVFFLAAIFFVPFGQYIFEQGKGTSMSRGLFRGVSKTADSFIARVDLQNKSLLQNIHQLETALEENSMLRKVFLPPMQYVLLRFFRQGNDKVMVGRDGWLHFAPGVEYLYGQPFLDHHQLTKRAAAHEIYEPPIQSHPLTTIIAFKNQLAERGIELIVLPVPVKAALQPTTLSARSIRPPLANRSWPQFVRALEEGGVRLFDARPVLQRYQEKHGASYLATDTHWLPGAMQATAAELAETLTRLFPALKGNGGFVASPQTIVGQGDIARMLTLPEGAGLFAGQEVHNTQIMIGQNEFFQPNKKSEVLLLGDSFTNIYSADGLGWGFGGGFAEQLSYYLGQPVDLLARNDSGAYVTREMLAAELARGRDRLAGKKVVIWQFAERELAVGDWREIGLVLHQQKTATFLAVASGETVKVTGLIGSVSRSPRPGAVPYRDNLITMHLVDLKGVDGKLEAEQALVYGWGMRDNQLTRFAALRPGDSVTLTLSSWETVEGEFGSYRRSPLDDEAVELELPNWGVLRDEKTP